MQKRVCAESSQETPTKKIRSEVSQGENKSDVPDEDAEFLSPSAFMWYLQRDLEEIDLKTFVIHDASSNKFASVLFQKSKALVVDTNVYRDAKQEKDQEDVWATILSETKATQNFSTSILRVTGLSELLGIFQGVSYTMYIETRIRCGDSVMISRFGDIGNASIMATLAAEAREYLSTESALEVFMDWITENHEKDTDTVSKWSTRVFNEHTKYVQLATPRKTGQHKYKPPQMSPGLSSITLVSPLPEHMNIMKRFQSKIGKVYAQIQKDVLKCVTETESSHTHPSSILSSISLSLSLSLSLSFSLSLSTHTHSVTHIPFSFSLQNLDLVEDQQQIRDLCNAKVLEFHTAQTKRVVALSESWDYTGIMMQNKFKQKIAELDAQLTGVLIHRVDAAGLELATSTGAVNAEVIKRKNPVTKIDFNLTQ